MHAEQGGGGAKLDCEIAIAHCIHRVLGHSRPVFFIDEPEQAGGEFAVEREGRAGDGSAAERADVGAVKTVLEALRIPC